MCTTSSVSVCGTGTEAGASSKQRRRRCGVDRKSSGTLVFAGTSPDLDQPRRLPSWNLVSLAAMRARLVLLLICNFYIERAT
jgi:hypothetical protein